MIFLIEAAHLSWTACNGAPRTALPRVLNFTCVSLCASSMKAVQSGGAKMISKELVENGVT